MVLSRDGAFCAQAGPGLRVLRASGPYEAAAELLAGPTLALVVDLRALASRHARLVEIALQLGADVIGCGRLPAGADAAALSGMRLLAAADVPTHLQRLLDQEAAPMPAPTGPSMDAPVPVPPAFEESVEPQAAPEPEPVREAEPPRPQARTVARTRTAQPQTVDELISPQELDALLGDKP